MFWLHADVTRPIQHIVHHVLKDIGLQMLWQPDTITCTLV